MLTAPRRPAADRRAGEPDPDVGCRRPGEDGGRGHRRQPQGGRVRCPGNKKEKASFGFLMGAVMKATGGKANPKVVQEILARKIAAIYGA